jgi:hypothetical protein
MIGEEDLFDGKCYTKSLVCCSDEGEVYALTKEVLYLDLITD